MGHEITGPETPDEAEPATLSLDQIMAAEADREPVAVFVPQWAGYVRVRSLRVSETEKIERIATDPRTGVRDDAKARVLTFMESLVEPKLGFAEAQKLLLDGHTASIGWLWSEINRVNGMGPQAVADAMRTFRRQSAAGSAVHAGGEARQDG